MRTPQLHRTLAGAAAVLAAAVASPSKAKAQNLVSNGSFELPGFSSPPSFRYMANGDNTTLAGWTVIDDGVGEQPYLMKAPDYSVADGQYAVFLNQGSGLRTTFAATAGTTYTLSFFLGNTNALLPTPLAVTVGSVTTTFVPGAGPYARRSFDFTATTTNPATLLQFFNSSPVGDFRAYSLDAVSIAPSAVVPEPSTYALLTAGLAGVGAVARRRRRATTV